jgi:hypothetical protein
VILSQKVQDKVSTDTVVTIRASSLSGLLPWAQHESTVWAGSVAE